jgi:hypothetical protein
VCGQDHHLLLFIEEDETSLDRLCLFDEATFHVWGSENPLDVSENKCDSPKVNIWCTFMKNKVTDPFFFFYRTSGDWCHFSGSAGERFYIMSV